MALTLSTILSHFKPSGLLTRSREWRIGFGAMFPGARFEAVGAIADAVADDGLE